jgi:hypothetical protein
MTFVTRILVASVVALPIVAVACGSSDGGGGGGTGGTGGTPENTGSACTAPTDCFPGLEAGALKGAVACLSVTGGYCTHECTTDADCCAVAGECKSNLPEVCSPFESSGKKYCFLKCDDATVAAANVTSDGGTVTDSTQYCQLEANSTFTCRSTGGGAQNQKVCAP